MSVERYLIVKSPLNIECFNVKIKLICITFTWIYSALMIMIQLFSKNSFVLEGMLTSCSFDYLSRDSLSRCYMLLMLVGGFVIPFMLIIIFYVLTKKEIKKKNNYFFRMNSSELRRSLNSMSLIEDNSLNSREMGPILTKKDLVEGGTKICEWKEKFLPAKKNTSSERKTSSTQSSKNYYYFLLRREKRVLKRIILNVTCFCLAWMPYVIMTLTAQFGNNIENYINPFSTSIPGIIAKISSIYNPILYTLTNKNCKNYYKRLLRISKE
ncbi:hypothetical protein BpHYR1_022494 [Brachionus plicatilis]|uniref:G-protein coupled receptors family 1 profile domain-containing protein n=1 Tax=Brachionus plicatilis TaxID=10195 RepID=A0A3M7R3E4_BRAPC|nr:hypothetical protein BpHYR1_022494 [Brachionus plicatilis]